MATREIKPGQIVEFPNVAQSFQSDAYGIKAATSGPWPDQGEIQVIPGAGNTAFSVTFEHTLDQSQGWQVIATVTTQTPQIVSVLGGFLRITVGTATGGPVTAIFTVG